MFRMDSAVTFIVLVGFVSVWTGAQCVSFSILFSAGTQLLVLTSEEAALHHPMTPDSHPPSTQILASVPRDPGSRHLLVCLLSGLKSPLQNVLWWVNDTVVSSEGTDISLRRVEEGGSYSTISVWELSAAEWMSRSMYWCGTVQEGQVYRQRMCPQDRLIHTGLRTQRPKRRRRTAEQENNK